MWQSHTKDDLMIEVWEKLDCENVGAKEIAAIENAVREKFGVSAVESPMVIARLLADEGAELRHSEIMQLWLERNQETGYEAVFRNILKLDSLDHAHSTIRDLENARRKYLSDEDDHGTRLARETALRGKKQLLAEAEKKSLHDDVRQRNIEIAQWLTLWLQSPELFENWIVIRKRSVDFVNRFGSSEK